MKRSSRYCAFAFLLFAGFEQAAAQADALAPLQAKLAAYRQQNRSEKLFVHTDKTVYTAGDILWLKVYSVDGDSRQPLDFSKVAYVELLDAANLPAARLKIALSANGGDGSVQLPLNLNSGYYLLRAYTNWMKNGSSEYFFEKRLTVINPLKSLGTTETQPAAGAQADAFPEGGNLVNGLPSRVAFRLTNGFGQGLEGNGYLLNEQADTLVRFRPVKAGTGSFDLVPRQGQRYKLLFRLADGSLVSKPLPAAYEQGYVMRLQEIDGRRVKITVWTNLRTGYPEVYLLAQTGGRVKSAQRSVVADGVATFYLDKDELGDGVSQLTIFNSDKQPVCERMYFVQPKAVNLASLQPGKEGYGPREQVQVNVSLPVAANASLAVYALDSLQAPEAITIDQYLLLTSELTGTVEDPAFYLTDGNENAQQAADLLMLTQGWRRFRWEELSANNRVRYPAEKAGPVVQARVIDTRTNATARDVQVFLSLPQSRYKLYSTQSDSAGVARFTVPDDFGFGEMILQTNTQKDSGYRVEPLSPYWEEHPRRMLPAFSLSPGNQAALLNRSIGMQTQHVYTADSLRRFVAPALSDTFPFYGKAPYTYKLDDYTRFRTMEEVLREYVREVNVGTKGSGASLRFKLFNETDRELYTDDILVTVDGVPLFNPGQVFSVDPLRIKTLDIIPRNYIMGYSAFHGVANFSSYGGNFEGFSPDPKAVVVDYEGLQLSRTFYAPVYATPEQRASRLPDLRNTLYWQPYVANAPVSFYTGDSKGTFVVVLQGIAADGKPFSKSTTFTVK